MRLFLIKKTIQEELHFMLIFHLIMPASVEAVELVSVHPPVLVTGLDRDAIFTCIIPTSAVIVDVEWLINGTSLDSRQLNDVSQFNVVSLQFVSVPLEYNTTMVQCRANTSTHGIVTSRNSTLFIQGNSHRTLLYEDYSVELSWRAPFTMDNQQSITYCIDVTNATSSSLLDSECGINITEFTYSLPPRSECDLHTFTVTPVNVAGNGTRKSFNFSYAPIVMNIFHLPHLLTFTSYFALMSAPVCHAELTFIDIKTGDITSLEDNDLTIIETSITFTTQQVRKNRHYNVSVTAFTAAGIIESGTMTSTHDIKNVTVSENTGVIIQTDYFEHSSASGALYIFVPLDDSGAADLTGAVYLILDKNTSHNHTLPFSLSGGKMKVFVYDIESDGTLAGGVGYPAVNREIPSGTTQGLPFQSLDSLLKNCTVITTDHVITVQCGSTDSTVTGFQMIAQLSSAHKLEALYINQAVDFQALNFQAQTSVLVEENGLYQVVVFAVRRGRGILYSSAEVMGLIMVNGSVSTTTASSATASTATNNIAAPTLGIGIGLGISVLLSGSLVVIIIKLYFKTRITITGKGKPMEENVQLEQLGEAREDIPQLYEEIRNVHTETSAETAQPSGMATRVPEYEDVGLTATNFYQITQCSAYGVSLN